MKTRNGFVTNSSSTCYILDLREPDVKAALQSTLRVWNEETVYGNGDTFFDYETDTLIDKEQYLIDNGYELVETEDVYGSQWKVYRAEIDLQNAKDDLGRQTSFCIGNDLLEMITAYREFEEKYSCETIGSWLSSFVEKLGIENTLFIRESDEGMGGFLSGEMHRVINEKSLAEMEYH